MPEPAREQLPASKQISTGALVQAFGGVKGLFDSSLPATVFVVVRLFASLNAAIAAAVVAGLVVVVLRKIRGESLQQAGSGFFGLLLAVLIARSTGTGKGFFLPGILLTAGSGVAFVISLLVRRPAVALALAAFDPRYGAWRELPALRRACVLSTAAWAGSFFIRAGVAAFFYSRPGDHPGTLLLVVNAVKWPLIIGAALLTVFLVKRANVPELDAQT